MNYNTQLCKNSLGEKITGASHAVYVFLFKNRDSNFFGALARSGNRSVKRLFNIERKRMFSILQMELVKCEANKELALGIFGLKTVFLQLNEIMGFNMLFGN